MFSKQQEENGRSCQQKNAEIIKLRKLQMFRIEIDGLCGDSGKMRPQHDNADLHKEKCFELRNRIIMLRDE